MSTQEKTSTCSRFSDEEIHQQINRIFLTKPFSGSEILRHFLSFIVEETINGHSTWLKEYTIAVNVLNKPADFKPQNDCIVRIHAGRLRRALNRYYSEKGALEPMRISIPKGSYIPVFHESNTTIADTLKNSDSNDGTPDTCDGAIVAVIPFSHLQSNPLENSLANGLGLQLSTALMGINHFSVIAYHIMRNLSENTTDTRQIADNIHAMYIITGDIQSIGNLARIFVQIIHTPTNKQVWSRMYDRDITAENIFRVQDEITELIVPALEKVCKPKRELESKSRLAIA